MLYGPKIVVTWDSREHVRGRLAFLLGWRLGREKRNGYHDFGSLGVSSTKSHDWCLHTYEYIHKNNDQKSTT